MDGNGGGGIIMMMITTTCQAQNLCIILMYVFVISIKQTLNKCLAHNMHMPKCSSCAYASIKLECILSHHIPFEMEVIYSTFVEFGLHMVFNVYTHSTVCVCLYDDGTVMRKKNGGNRSLFWSASYCMGVIKYHQILNWRDM